MRRFQLLDTTLREGEQRAGVRFHYEEKRTIVALLERFGVDLIEIGHPGISAQDEDMCRRVAASATRAEILMHARAQPDEVQAVARAGADWIGIWASINNIALTAKFVGRCEGHVLAKVEAAIHEAKQLGLKVRFTIEDASRTDWDRLTDLARVATRAGVDRISLADTVGTLDPDATKALFGRAIDEWGCELAGHFHNDLGLAQANALAAIDVGVAVVDVSICGLGERAGITDLLQFATALRHLRGEERFCLPLIPELVEAIVQTTGHQPDDLRPVIGSNAFTHTSRYHVQAMQRLAVAYEAFPPEWVGRVRELIVDRPALRDHSPAVETADHRAPSAPSAGELRDLAVVDRPS